MPALTMSGLLLFTGAVAGAAVGWYLCSRRDDSDDEAARAGWQDTAQARRGEHKRLLDQNRDLMQQVKELRAAEDDAVGRTRELSAVLKEALAGRDELQREARIIRSKLEAAVAERRRLAKECEELAGAQDSRGAALREKDDKIFHMSRELESWQNRLPPLIDRYRERDEEASRLARELEEANERFDALQRMLDADETRVESARAEAMTGGTVASNDPLPPHNGHDGGGVAGGDIAASGAHGVPTTGGSPVECTEFGEPKDDLKAIKGVGPAIEKTLNELGIYSYGQIARMTEYEINRVADRLKGFRTRVYREDWIGQARALQSAPPGEPG